MKKKRVRKASWFHEFWCWLGYHEWVQPGHEYWHRYCKYCGKWQDDGYSPWG